MFEHKLQDVQNRLMRPIASATGLPNERYVHAAAFPADRDYVISKTWACIAFVDDLPENNYVLPVDFMGVPLVVTKDGDGHIRVFHNVCSHRGLHLADKPCKTNGMLRCPYHSWTYKLNGELRGTPHIGGYGQHSHPDFDRDSAHLKTVRSSVWLGAVFINLSGDAIPFEEYTAPLEKQFDRLCTADDRATFASGSTGCNTTMTVKSNWKLPVENFLEAYHLPTVHPELNKTSPLDEHFDLERFDYGGGQGSYNYKPTIIDNKTLPTLPSWSAETDNQAVYPVLYPNTFLGLHKDHLFIMYLQPTANDETVEHVRISYVGDEGLGEGYREHHKSLLDAWTEVFKEDIFAVERMQKGRFSPAYQGGVFSPTMDEATLHFHQWVGGQLLANTP